MEPALRQRLTGALVLVALAIIFVPMLVVERSPDEVAVAPVRTLSTPPPMPELAPTPAQVGIPVAPKAALSERVGPDAPMDAPEGGLDEPPPPERLPGALRPGTGQAAPPPSGSNIPASPVTRAGVVRPEGWVVQVASFASSENADALVAELKGKGLPAYVEQVHNPGSAGTFRVRVGPQISEEAARAVAKDVAKLTELAPIVIRFP